MASEEADPELGAVETAKSGGGYLAELGARIVRLRSEKGWDRVVLARKLGVSRDRLSKWERGKNAPPLKILVLLGNLLEVTLDELVTGRPWAGDARRFRRNPLLAFAGLPGMSEALGIDPDG